MPDSKFPQCMQTYVHYTIAVIVRKESVRVADGLRVFLSRRVFEATWERMVIVCIVALVLVTATGCQDWAEQDPNPFAGEKFYVDPNSKAKRQAEEWRGSRPKDARQMEKIASEPATYYFGEWTEKVSGGTAGQVDNRVSVITEAGTLPVLGAYAIPHRDCGGYASGGFATEEEYRSWIREYAKGIGDRKAVVILEPDALADTSCLSAAERWSRFALIRDAVNVLKKNPKTAVYIDAGHPDWQSASTMAHRLRSASVDQADGFSLNVSNFFSTSQNIAYGEKISRLTGGKHFVIDTSRNGLGPAPDSDWCNPEGRALGRQPTANTGEPLVDAYFWLKWPGESDGQCKGNPRPGIWMPEYALGLARRASY